MPTEEPGVPRTDAFRILYRLRDTPSMTARELAQYLYGRGGSGTTVRSQTSSILRTMEQLGFVSREVQPAIPPRRLAIHLWSLEEDGKRFLEFVEGTSGQVAV